MWRSNMLVSVDPVNDASRRICAVTISSNSWKVLLVNVYRPYESDALKTVEFIDLLTIIKEIVMSHSASHIIVGGGHWSLVTICGDACPLSCVSAEACFTSWPNAQDRRDGEVN